MLAIEHYGTLPPSRNHLQLLIILHRVVVVILALSSLAFYAMAFRVPVVSFIELHNMHGRADQL
jgi:hypothetical protein